MQKLTVPENKTGTYTFLRNGKDTVKVEMMFDDKGRSHIGFQSIDKALGSKHTSYSLVKAIPAGWNKCWETLGRYIRNLKLLFTSKEVKVKDSLGSVVSIANTFGGTWDWEVFWTFTAIFSIILAFMNILPIPALDGGHALFCLIEIITGRKPSDKFMEVAQTVGMILLLGLMAYALGLDFWRIFTK
jgi:regulator of sigma E protease